MNNSLVFWFQRPEVPYETYTLSVLRIASSTIGRDGLR